MVVAVFSVTFGGGLIGCAERAHRSFMTNTNQYPGKGIVRLTAEYMAAARKVAQEAIERRSTTVTAAIAARPVPVG